MFEGDGLVDASKVRKIHIIPADWATAAAQYEFESGASGGKAKRNYTPKGTHASEDAPFKDHN